MHDFGDHLQVVAFTVHGVEYAFPIDGVKEIIRYQEPQPTSSGTAWMRGVINLRGTIVPIIDLGARLGLEPSEDVDERTSRILVLEHGDVVLGAIVSSVDEVRTISREAVQDATGLAGVASVAGVLTIGERLVLLLDAGELLEIGQRAA